MADILIIDDDENMCDLLSRMLLLDKHFVSVAQDGEHALKIYGQCKPDLIITDIMMPNKNGIDFMIELENLGNDVPIIAMSGNPNTFLEGGDLMPPLVSAEILGAKAVLYKPFNQAKLKNAIQKALG
jgi:CheY-like chemotaxis protein